MDEFNPWTNVRVMFSKVLANSTPIHRQQLIKALEEIIEDVRAYDANPQTPTEKVGVSCIHHGEN